MVWAAAAASKILPAAHIVETIYNKCIGPMGRDDKPRIYSNRLLHREAAELSQVIT